ncbi:MAG: MotA/TolQ/ExbB proton channel family protein [Deltaproteobacteria bacterium]|jgi:biopolymer transport protein ExbB|nr:MotA/TolQ/ExbB proton channel family protein [Deltaproteobacteria bacterium]MCL5879721.1 MotA/TolQ/ExbB proton channel family protein [Deltaproteobacteria bacterium]MDA8304150.1 MotA/TolQ/ExbB proton channel family protein [Deltaproteobacteria bacterium]
MFNQSELLTEFFLYPLILCSIVALAIIIERFYSLRKSKIFPEDFLSNVEESLKNGDIEKAKGICLLSKTPISRIYLAIIDNYKNSADTIKLEVEESGKRAYLDLEKNLEGLSAITTIAPLLGLLGTVVGMIKALSAVSYQSGITNPHLLALGISEALYSTALGLIIAIISFLFYKYFASKAFNFGALMEDTASKVIAFIK